MRNTALKTALSEQRLNTETFEFVLQRLLHHVKNPLATAAMAVHNLQLVLTRKNIPDNSDDDLNEYIDSAKDAVQMATTFIKEAETVCNINSTSLKEQNIGHLIESTLDGNGTGANIKSELSPDLYGVQTESRLFMLLIKKLLILSTTAAGANELVHIQAENDSASNNKIIVRIFNHKHLTADTQRDSAKPVTTADIPAEKKEPLYIAQHILNRHQQKLYGHYNPESGGFFYFNV